MSRNNNKRQIKKTWENGAKSSLCDAINFEVDVSEIIGYNFRVPVLPLP